VAYARHERDRPFVQYSDHPLSEFLGFCLVKIWYGQNTPFYAYYDNDRLPQSRQ